MSTLQKIKKNYEFKNIYNNKKYYAEEYLVLYLLKNNLGYNRVGFSVSKKVGKAVIRNKTKRLMRENYRLINDRLKEGYDIVITARVKSGEADFYQIKKCMISAFKRAKILKEVN